MENDPLANVTVRYRRGTFKLGERAYLAIHKDTRPVKEIAAEYSVSRSLIYNIKKLMQEKAAV